MKKKNSLFLLDVESIYVYVDFNPHNYLGFDLIYTATPKMQSYDRTIIEGVLKKEFYVPLSFQWLSVYSFLGCLWRRERILQVIPNSGTRTFLPASCQSLCFHLWFSFFFFFLAAQFSKKQFRSEARRSVRIVGEGTRRRPLHFSQLPKHIPPRHRVCLHPRR